MRYLQLAERAIACSETIREYALVKLTEAEEVTLLRDHHLEYFMKLAEKFWRLIFSRQRKWSGLPWWK